ncbi:GNAT family N-acetyltransferase [Acuticoccus sp.]|uniref:GNAT family N-acetyltransferase n=1 Tax=Acuticoccus sp. TaxID=1904378 RepID=UPI003B51F92C
MIRDATTGDAGAICAIWNDVIRSPHITFTTLERSEAEVAALIAHGAVAGLPFLVVEEREVLGFATYAQFRRGPGYARTVEHTINLASSAQGHGHGRSLMNALLDRARQGGVRSMVGAVSGANPAAIAFHGRMGFTRVGLIPDAGYKYGAWLDLVLMQRRLEGAGGGPPAPGAPTASAG